MREPQVSTFPHRMMALPPSVREAIQARFETTERRILTAASSEPLVAQMYYKQWLDGMEAALRAAEATEI